MLWKTCCLNQRENSLPLEMHIDDYNSSISSKDKKHAIVLHFNGVKYEVFTLELIIVDWI